MASVKQGTRTASGEWWKHLSYMKRPYWKGERQAVKRDIAAEVAEHAVKRSPGEVLSEYFNGAGCYEISDLTGLDVMEVYKILNGIMAIRPYHAQAFASYLGTSAEVWMQIQEDFNYDSSSGC